MKTFREFLNEKVIKLGASSTEKSRAFMDDLHATSQPHPTSRHHRVIGGASVEMSPRGNDVHLHDVLSHQPHTGAGTAALHHVQRLADKHGVRITATAKAYSKDKEHVRDTDHLKKWYRKHGFAVERGTKKDGYDIRYDPK